MGGASAQALLASLAYDIDLPHHTLTDPRGVVRLHDFADKLMPEDTRVGIVAFDQFQVRSFFPLRFFLLLLLLPSLANSKYFLFKLKPESLTWNH